MTGTSLSGLKKVQWHLSATRAELRVLTSLTAASASLDSMDKTIGTNEHRQTCWMVTRCEREVLKVEEMIGGAPSTRRFEAMSRNRG